MKPTDIKAIRLRLGLSQEALARLLGVCFQTVNRWERGVYRPSNLAISKIKALSDTPACRDKPYQPDYMHY